MLLNSVLNDGHEIVGVICTRAMIAIRIHTYTHTHTRTYAYIHTCTHTYIHTYIRTYIDTANLRACHVHFVVTLDLSRVHARLVQLYHTLGLS